MLNSCTHSERYKNWEIMQILLLLGLINLLGGQPLPPHCCTPDEQWEASGGFIVFSVTGGVVSQTQVIRFFSISGVYWA